LSDELKGRYFLARDGIFYFLEDDKPVLDLPLEMLLHNTYDQIISKGKKTADIDQPKCK